MKGWFGLGGVARQKTQNTDKDDAAISGQTGGGKMAGKT